MFPPFPQEQAKIQCFKLMEELDNGLFCSFLKNSPGQMFATAVCQDGTLLRAFSGQLAGEGRWILPGFVPPCINTEKWKAEVFESDPKIKDLTTKIQKLENQIKLEKEQKDKKSNANPAGFEIQIQPEPKSFIEKQDFLAKEILKLKKMRKKLSNESLRKIYDMYSFTCHDGHIETYKTLAADLNLKKTKDVFSIPTGTGDCCAPKLLNYAYANNLKIISMAEFFYGNEPSSGQKKHKNFYPPCDEKCSLILPKMLGLHILYKDQDIIVVNKPSGILSAPGKGPEKFDCIPYRVKKLIPECIEQPCVHRLDMDTSGLLVLGLTKEAHKNLSIQFQDRKVNKKYRALLCGKLSSKFKEQKSGLINFPIRVDINNRPYQIYDEKYGRASLTQWQVLKEYKLNKNSNNEIYEENCENQYANSSCKSTNEQWRTLVEFSPITGRTHQLRVHSAHEKGLGLPIVGDRLYGVNLNGERLCLQAFYLEFEHPINKEKMKFELPIDFSLDS
ncbi:MAG: RluA family pseudouridine synthase [Treponemataceae bacterium]